MHNHVFYYQIIARRFLAVSKNRTKKEMMQEPWFNMRNNRIKCIL